MLDGDFSVEYIFPDDGTHQVITRIDKGSGVQVLASFNVFVPHQAPPSLLNPFSNAPASEIESITRMITIVISFLIIIVVIIMLKKGQGKKKRRQGWDIMNEIVKKICQEHPLSYSLDCMIKTLFMILLLN